MRILSCHIENFGKLHDRTFDFSAPITWICQENGWGKSTLAAFLCAMFYGLEGNRKRNMEENERKRYQPWQGGIFGGQVTFEVGEKQYVLSRIFREKESADEFELRDRETNKKSEDYSSHIGEELFQLHRDSFMRSIFIGQGSMVTTATHEIQSRIGTWAEAEGDGGRYETAKEALTELLRELTPRRSTGRLYKLQQEITTLERQVREGSFAREELERYEELAESEQETLRKQQAEEKRLLAGQERLIVRQQEQARRQAETERALRGQEKRRQWQELCQMTDRREQEFEEKGKPFPDRIPNLQELDSQIAKGHTLELKKEELESRLSQGSPSRQEYEPSFEKGAGLLFLVLSILFMGMGGYSFWKLGWVQGLIWMAAAIFLLAAAGILLSKIRKNHQDREEEREELRQEERALEQEILSYLKSLGFRPEREQLLSQLYRIRSALLEYEQAEKNYQEAMTRQEAYLEAMGADREYILYGGRNGQAENSRNPGAQGTIEGQQEGHIEDNPEDSLLLLQQLQREMEAVREQMEATKKVLTEYQDQMAALREGIEEWNDRKARLESKQEEKTRLSRQFTLLEETQTLLAEAKESLTNRYAGPVYGKFQEYFEILTGEPAEGYHLDANLNITVDALGKQRETKVLSAGYQDLISLALRLAFAYVMYPNEHPFLLMDDPFTNLDEEKTQAGMRLLENIKTEYQIIYFTCTPARTGEPSLFS